MIAVSYHEHGPDESRGYVDELVALYVEVFADEPYNEGPEQVGRFRGWLNKELAEPGFSLVCALHHDELIGMAYGYTKGPGEWWHNATLKPPASILAGNKLAVMEWAVRRAHRGRGVGRQVMARLLADRPEPFATLKVNPAAVAYDIYLRSGWQLYGQARRPNLPAVDILVLDLSAPEHRSSTDHPAG